MKWTSEASPFDAFFLYEMKEMGASKVLFSAQYSFDPGEDVWHFCQKGTSSPYELRGALSLARVMMNSDGVAKAFVYDDWPIMYRRNDQVSREIQLMPRIEGFGLLDQERDGYLAKFILQQWSHYESQICGLTLELAQEITNADLLEKHNLICHLDPRPAKDNLAMLAVRYPRSISTLWFDI